MHLSFDVDPGLLVVGILWVLADLGFATWAAVSLVSSISPMCASIGYAMMAATFVLLVILFATTWMYIRQKKQHASSPTTRWRWYHLGACVLRDIAFLIAVVYYWVKSGNLKHCEAPHMPVDLWITLRMFDLLLVVICSCMYYCTHPCGSTNDNSSMLRSSNDDERSDAPSELRLNATQ